MIRRVFPVFLICVAAVLALPAPCDAAMTVRKPVCAGSFYPASADELRRDIARYTREARSAPVTVPRGMKLRALIMPHAGYVYSGRTAAYASLALKGQRFSRVVLMGPDHRVGFSNISVSAADAYETPLGLVRLHEDAARLRMGGGMFRTVPASDAAEHSLEVILPFLQTYVGSFTLVPLVMGPGDVMAYARSVCALANEDTLLVASSDLSHFLPRERAAARDARTISLITDLNGRGLAADDNRACGAIPIRVILECARSRGWKARLLHYATSADASGDTGRVVGYATIAFFGGTSMEQSYTKEQGRALVTLARSTIQEKLGVPVTQSPAQEQALKDAALQTKAGTFVTLTMGGELRGCIGSLEARDSIVDGVRHNALNAAFRDPRFPALTRKELDRVRIEVSVLTEPRPLAYTDAQDLLNKIRPGIDGLIIRKGFAAATFLPQVWDQLPDKKEFLEHLCMKAGLPHDAWTKGDLEVQTYQVQYFEEDR
ncbi:MAG TPA: AmmeMemoRadiSam system protein B [Deltaproteobacteria bacterium]|nr:AmmeMemoRadiSam system protein B [Deltaproteobacteria bacterium]